MPLTTTLLSLSRMTWMFLPLLILIAIQTLSSRLETIRMLAKSTLYYLFVLYAVYCFAPRAEHDFLFSLATRFYFLIQSAELLWFDSKKQPPLKGPAADQAPTTRVFIWVKTTGLHILTTVLSMAWFLLGLLHH